MKGRTDVVADVLSRGCVGAINTDSLADWNRVVVSKLQTQEDTKWMEELKKDRKFVKIIDTLLEGNMNGEVSGLGQNNQ